jgi:uncharacterized protein DUF4232
VVPHWPGILRAATRKELHVRSRAFPVVAVVVGMTAACSSADQGVVGGADESTVVTSVAASEDGEPPRCGADALAGELRAGDPGAGQRYATLLVRNTSGSICTLYGYGGLELVDAANEPLPTELHRTSDPEPRTVTLAPGETAAKNLHWGAVPGEDEPTTGPCEPTADHLDVIPPDGTGRFQVPWSFGPVCQQGRIDGSAYHPSSGAEQ